MLACSLPVSGHDLYEIELVFKELCKILQEAGIKTEGLFLNTDAGFDAEVFRKLCAETEIEANIAVNPRNNALEEEYMYFDEKLFGWKTIWIVKLKPLFPRIFMRTV